MAEQDNIELTVLDDSSGRQIPQLKPVDRGRAAWQVLLAAFIFEALFWGFPNAFGVFQAYYSTLPAFQHSSNIPVIGTLSQLCWIGAPFAAALTKALPRHKLHLIVFGWLLAILGLLAASFAKTVTGLLATQGLMYGVGFVVLTYPILDILSEWWVARKGMAFGLISAASGLTGIVMPFILEASLARFGYEITLRASAVVMAVLTAPLIPLLKERLPVSEVSARQRMDWRFLRIPLFWFYATAVTIQGFGQFIPPIFVSSYAVAVGLSSLQAASLLAVMAAAQTLGQAAFGWLSDKKVSLNVLTSSCCIVAAGASATAWGLGKDLPVLVVYSVLYGFFAFGFGTMRVAMGRAVTTEQSAMLATYSSFVFLQGIGNALVGPVTAGLITSRVDVMAYGALKYRSTVVFVALTSAVAGVVILAQSAMKRIKIMIDSPIQ